MATEEKEATVEELPRAKYECIVGTTYPVEDEFGRVRIIRFHENDAKASGNQAQRFIEVAGGTEMPKYFKPKNRQACKDRDVPFVMSEEASTMASQDEVAKVRQEADAASKASHDQIAQLTALVLQLQADIRPTHEQVIATFSSEEMVEMLVAKGEGANKGWKPDTLAKHVLKHPDLWKGKIAQ